MQTHLGQVAVSGPDRTRHGIRVRTEYWRSQESDQRSVFLPKDAERFAQSGFIPNIIVTLASQGQLPGSPMTEPAGSQDNICRSRWQAEAAGCEEELTVTPLGTTALIQIRTVLASGDIQAEVVATLLDQDLAEIACHIRDFFSEIEFTTTGDTNDN